MVVRQGFYSFLKFSSRVLLEELKHSLSRISKCNFPLSLRWCYNILDYENSQRDLSRMRCLNPSFSSFELSRIRFHLKHTLQIFFSIMVFIADPIFHCMLWVKEVLHILLLPRNQFFSVSGRLSPHHFEMFSVSPGQAFPFRCWFFQQLV